MQEPEANMEILEKHMHHTALLLEEIYGSTILKWAGDIFNTKFQFTPEDLEFLVKNNPIIPAGRENIFLAGLYHGLKGEIYISLHILAPQVENLFRCIAENAGAIMTTLKDDDTSDAKLLTSIFDTPELVATLDKGKHDKQQKNGLSTLPKTPPGCKKGGVFAWQGKEENIPRAGLK